jgi:SOS-response transcriptional repressor LexA
MKKETYLQANKRTYKFVFMNTLADRMKLARKHGNLTQKALALKAGVEQPVISQLETGKNLQSAHLAKFAHLCGVSAIWLSEGIGEMVPGAEPEASNVAMAVQPNMMYRYPVISWVAAGSWAEAVEPYPPGFSDHYEMSEYNSKGPAFWLEVKGDSMTSPVGQSVPEGSLILVDTEADAYSGKLVIAKLSNSDKATFKKLVDDGGRRFLKPLNPAYPMETCEDDCRIIGVVVRALMKL